MHARLEYRNSFFLLYDIKFFPWIDRKIQASKEINTCLALARRTLEY